MQTVFACGVFVLLSVSAGTCAARQHTADERFKALDANRDGVITKYEYDSHAAFASMDANHNNRISASELEAVLGAQLDGMPSAADRIRVADLNGDGELTEEELRRAAEFRFNWLDSNQDGHVDLSEMRSGFGVHVLH
ncbi:MAG: EF-hand domain-containing protein [Luteimonas sp.]